MFFTLTSQEPDQWEPETGDEAGIEEEEVVLIIIYLKDVYQDVLSLFL